MNTCPHCNAVLVENRIDLYVCGTYIVTTVDMQAKQVIACSQSEQCRDRQLSQLLIASLCAGFGIAPVEPVFSSNDEYSLTLQCSAGVEFSIDMQNQVVYYSRNGTEISQLRIAGLTLEP